MRMLLEPSWSGAMSLCKRLGRRANPLFVILVSTVVFTPIFTAQSASGASSLLAVETRSLCLNPAYNHMSLVVLLSEIGWERIPGEELSDASIASYAAKLIVPHLARTQSGSQWMRVWEREHHMAGGLRRVHYDDTLEYRRLFFEHSHSAGFLEMSVSESSQERVIYCDLILENSGGLVFDEKTQEVDSAGIVYPISRRNVLEDDGQASVQLVWQLDSEKISKLIGQSFTSRYVMTFNSRPMPLTQN